MEHCLVYVSSATRLLSEPELLVLTRQSRKKNRDAGITGVLFYFNGSILQVLEGEQQRVNRLYETISKDPRHMHVTQLHSGPIEKRSFPNWLMGYKTLSGSSLNQVADLLAGYAQDQNNVVRKIVQIFCRNNLRI